MCKNCNIAIGTFYNYFSSKDYLVREIFVSDWEKSIKIIEKIKLSDTTLKEKIYNFVCLNQNNYMSFEELYQILNL
ncbi:TetR/AcrR family transcriptional regulator [Clostridium botulinum]|uniref:TetR/AcrR family transcriptional regulator n=2 Tax=Clostridium botulinum TaxID=1491 RepID=UPI0007E0843F|nr:TetR family transcriptional regulator [Clostridium botulinum B2 275]NFM47740.1 TetR/AcrR family transcriptional regulator [Clostridium botulinum]